MDLPGGGNLIRQTFQRALAIEGVDEILTVTSRELYFKTLDEYTSVGTKGVALNFILEPFGRNTAAAVALAALQVAARHGPEAQILVLPADHLIKKTAAFTKAVGHAQSLAAEAWLVTFGVAPEFSETGFGYLRKGEALDGDGCFEIQQVIEKPDKDTAQAFLESGEYYWNSGIFCYRVDALIEAFEHHAPEIIRGVGSCIARSSQMAGTDRLCLDVDPQAFALVPAVSIDCALMQRSERVATVVSTGMEWSDIGSWSAMSQLTAPDGDGNRCNGEVQVYLASNNYVHSKERLTALVGVEDLLVIDTPDALLVANKNHAQHVKYIVENLKRTGHDAHLLHRTVYRPWGTYTVLEEGERFKIKRLVVKPKASLSLQMHHHRSEHWIVVSGMARVINDCQDMLLGTNQSTFIPAGRKHRLENPGVIDLVLIEVQSGDYLGENDIVRLLE